jgi:hypothetical protein
MHVCGVQGWDKTYSLRYLKESDYDEIHFFGDKTFEVPLMCGRLLLEPCALVGDSRAALLWLLDVGVAVGRAGTTGRSSHTPASKDTR